MIILICGLVIQDEIIFQISPPFLSPRPRTSESGTIICSSLDILRGWKRGRVRIMVKEWPWIFEFHKRPEGTYCELPVSIFGRCAASSRLTAFLFGRQSLHWGPCLWGRTRLWGAREREAKRRTRKTSGRLIDTHPHESYRNLCRTKSKVIWWWWFGVERHGYCPSSCLQKEVRTRSKSKKLLKRAKHVSTS